MADLVYGRVPHPPYTRNIIRKDVINGQGHGHTPISGGRGRPVGCIHHEWMDGGEEGEAFYTKFFRCPDGARHANALVDYFIMRSGKIVMINDPEGDRIPWASGGSGPYQGDGGAFVRKFGAQAVNRRLVSWEYCKRNNDNLTDAQRRDITRAMNRHTFDIAEHAGTLKVIDVMGRQLEKIGA